MTGDPKVFRRGLSAVPRPLVRQLLVLIPVLVDASVFPVWRNAGVRGGYYDAGLTILVAITLLAGAGLWTTLPPWAPSALLMVDIGAIGLMRLVPSGNGLGILLVLPALWLGVDRGRRGVALALAGTVGLASVPSLLYFGLEPGPVSRAMLMPVVVLICSLTMAGTAADWARQNAELEAIVDTVDVGLVALDRTGAYRFTNPRHQHFLDLAFPDGHDGHAGQDGWVYAADRITPVGHHDMPSIRAMQGEVFQDYVIWVGEDPATQRALSVSAGLVLDPDGEFDGAVLGYKDITDLMAALQVKDEFVASVSHELRTPLTAIMGFLDLALERCDLPDDTGRHLEIAKRNSERLLRLVGDLLLTAQVEEGHLALDRRDVDLCAVVRECVAGLAPAAEQAGIRVDVEVPRPVRLSGDPVRLGQLIDNLVSNAIKYSPSGGRISVRLTDSVEEVRLEVADRGIGIAPEDQKRLFTRFYRTSQASARAIQGVGLGLSITKSIAEAHGGEVSVESALGRGSTFVVRLPRVQAAPAQAGTAE